MSKKIKDSNMLCLKTHLGKKPPENKQTKNNLIINTHFINGHIGVCVCVSS